LAKLFDGVEVVVQETSAKLAAKVKLLGRRVLAEVATIVTPETLLAWPSEADGAEIRR